jgi:hypothetical protein
MMEPHHMLLLAAGLLAGAFIGLVVFGLLRSASCADCRQERDRWERIKYGE